TDVWGELRRLTIRAKRLVIESMKAPLLANDWAELGRILSRAAAVGDEVERLEIIRHVLPALWDGGRVELIAEEIHAVMSRLEEAPPTPLGLQVLSTLCQILILSDGPAAGLRWANIACGRASRLGDPSVMALAYLTRALGFHYVGRSRLASEDFAAARQVIQAAQLDKYRIPLMIYSSVASADMGDYGAASKLLDDAIRNTIQEGDWRNYVCAQHNRAFYAYEQGMLIEARQAANAALVRRGLGAWYNEASTWSLLGLISLDEGEHEQAAVVRERLLEGYLPRRIWGPDLSYIEIFLARMEVADGRRDLALARLSEVIAAYEHRDVFCLSRVQLEKARMLVGTDPDEARRLAREVRARGSEIGAQPLMDKAEAVLRSLRAGRAVGGGGGGGRS
ncbi:MAG TPA: hypothetical protein VFQ38_11425, partial [Longimicrobiales bacterium]|nr:hypothetical protein [Longimicrobiales bacterium]